MADELRSDETERLVALARYAILDTPPEPAFDRITRLAARLFDVPVALVSLVDEHREWFKSSYGFEHGEVARDASFCTHIVSTDEILVVPDAAHDPRFAGNPLVTEDPRIRFYAAAPLTTPDGHCLGALCIIDHVPRAHLADAERGTLEDLAAIVVDALELRLAGLQLRQEVVEREVMDAAWRDSQSQLQAILDHTSAMIYVKSTDGRYLLINKQYERLMHVTNTQVLGKTDYDIFPPELAHAYRANDRQVIEAGRPLEFEELVPHDDGLHTYIGVKFPLYNSQGVPYALGAIATDITARKQAEEALRESEERFRQLTEALDDFVWISSTETFQLIYMSPAYETIWGRPRRQLEDDPELWHQALHPDDRERIVALWAALSETPEEFNFEYRIVRPDGTIRWIWDRVFPVRNREGKTYRLAGIASDITAQKLAEREIHRLNAHLEQRVAERTAQLEAANQELQNEIAERKRVEEAARAEYAFRKAIEEANVSGVVAVDLAGATFYVNPAFCRMVGWSEDELLGEVPPYRYWPEEEFESLHNSLARAMKGQAPGSDLEVRFRRSTGERFDALVLAAPLDDAHGRLTGWIGSIYDITERKRAEAARQASEHKYRLLLEQAADGIFVADPQGNYVEVNAEGCRMLGYTRDEILSLNMHDLIPAEDQEQTPLRWSALDSGETVIMERRLRRKDGSLLLAELSARRLDDGILQALVRDITRRKQAEARLRESERRLAEAQRLARLGSWEWDPHSNHLTWSDEMYRIFGLQPQQFEATYEAFAARMHPDDRARFNEDVQRALRDHQPYTGERRILRSDGMLRFIRTQVKVELDEHSRPLRLVGAAQDVTEQKEVELRLQREAARTKVLLRVAARLNQELDVDAVLQAVCEETRRMLTVPLASVALVDHEHDCIVPAIDVGVPAEYQSLRKPLPRLVYDKLTNPRDYLIVPDVRSVPDQPSRELQEALNIRTVVGMSIMRRGELVGVLTVMTRDAVRQFTDDELALLRGLADQVGQAIANAQLFDQIRAAGVRMRQLTQQVVSAQEEERRRLSRELHDEAGQALTALEISLKLIDAGLPPSDTQLRRRLSDAIGLTGMTMDQIRLLAQDLRPPALDAVGLNLTLEGFCHSFGARTGLVVSYVGMEVPSLPDTINITLYRLLQEALTNIAKHAGAKQIGVALHCDVDSIMLSIEDDGRGFDKRRVLGIPRQNEGIGLVGMRERLELLGGHLEIETEQGRGTCLVASVPLQ